MLLHLLPHHSLVGHSLASVHMVLGCAVAGALPAACDQCSLHVPWYSEQQQGGAMQGALPDPMVPHSQQLGHHTATDLIQKLQETLQDEEDCRLWFKERTPTLLSGRQKALGVTTSWPWFPDGLVSLLSSVGQLSVLLQSRSCM